MNTIKTLERLQRIHTLIQQECTGSPCELASKMNLSERSIYYLMDYLRDFEADIAYDRGRKTYYYQSNFQLELTICLSVQTNNETTEILGGSYFSK